MSKDSNPAIQQDILTIFFLSKDHHTNINYDPVPMAGSESPNSCVAEIYVLYTLSVELIKQL